MKIEFQKVGSEIRIDLTPENEEELKQIRAFIVMTNGGIIDTGAGQTNPIFDLQARIESVGFDDAGEPDSIAFAVQEV